MFFQCIHSKTTSKELLTIGIVSTNHFIQRVVYFINLEDKHAIELVHYRVQVILIVLTHRVVVATFLPMITNFKILLVKHTWILFFTIEKIP